MRTRELVMIASLLLAGGAAADPYEGLGDRRLQDDLRRVEREIRSHADGMVKLERAARRSSNADRRTAIAALQEHMLEVVRHREDELGQEHTIMRNGEDVGTGLTDAAEVGTPMASKKTRRRLRKGEAEELPERLRRLTRMQTLVVTGERLAQPATERQGDTLQRYLDAVTEFAAILEVDRAELAAEIDRRQPAPAEADTAAADSTAG